MYNVTMEKCHILLWSKGFFGPDCLTKSPSTHIAEHVIGKHQWDTREIKQRWSAPYVSFVYAQCQKLKMICTRFIYSREMSIEYS